MRPQDGAGLHHGGADGDVLARAPHVDALVDGADSQALGVALHDFLRVHGIGAGRHSLSVTVSDFQETKNMENVAQVLPNTRAFVTSFLVR